MTAPRRGKRQARDDTSAGPAIAGYEREEHLVAARRLGGRIHKDRHGAGLPVGIPVEQDVAAFMAEAREARQHGSRPVPAILAGSVCEAVVKLPPAKVG